MTNKKTGKNKKAETQNHDFTKNWNYRPILEPTPAPTPEPTPEQEPTPEPTPEQKTDY